MQIKYTLPGLKGYKRLERIYYNSLMISEEAKRRKKILEFWEKYGLAATTEAFGVSRRTLFRWKKSFNDADGDIKALNPKSRRPKRVRESKVPIEVIKEIKRLRKAYPNIGKAKLYHLLKPFCEEKELKTPSESTIGRIIAKAPDTMRLFPYRIDTKGKVKPKKKTQKNRKPKNLKSKPFELWAVDTIQIVSNGIKRYILTMIDPLTRIAFAVAIPSKRAKHTAYALEALIDGITSIKQKRKLAILSDNGSEFKKEFDALLEQKGFTHYWTYPRSPKMNAHNERFNRTIQEQFIQYYEDLLFTDLDEFNKKLAKWLIDYNTKIPHSSLNFKSPVQYLLENHYECHMYWTYTLI
ncbi:Transposase InsO and inactivated derivatives [Nitratiruptor tergarcus DSM 16512]|uniref:Transposase InsO and inactivated derivatives n=1 Tax=Nitratiruptor tergarcus DSM 16512 TaxID=1069081 RepID=A0A1W1WR83_9BACT|nr:integrase core domain-containing protein [Nitratiruptor tergarcus]SMC08725.1 Transposase InsO and inactivated derivatives [Nitratiruptor tergarcus DSM 16512]